MYSASQDKTIRAYDLNSGPRHKVKFKTAWLQKKKLRKFDPNDLVPLIFRGHSKQIRCLAGVDLTMSDDKVLRQELHLARKNLKHNKGWLNKFQVETDPMAQVG